MGPKWTPDLPALCVGLTAQHNIFRVGPSTDEQEIIQPHTSDLQFQILAESQNQFIFISHFLDIMLVFF